MENNFLLPDSPKTAAKLVELLNFIDEEEDGEEEEENNPAQSTSNWVGNSTKNDNNKSTAASCTCNNGTTNSWRLQEPRRKCSPLAIWKRKFMWDYQCAEEDIYKEVFFSSLPHIAAFLAAALYIAASAWLFTLLDDSLESYNFHELLLFSFTTASTIGYGDIVPQSWSAKAFCMFHCLFGIPLVFVTLSKMGQLFAEFYWIFWAALRNKEEDIIAEDVQRLPLAIIALMIVAHSIVGGILFHFLLDDMPVLLAIYFCFISITTIGFGDISPKPTGLVQTLLIIVYLSAGISIMSTMFGAISDHLRRIHYLGRDFEHTQDVQIWFAGTRVSIRELVALVAQQFGVSPIRLREVLDELDQLIQLAAMQTHRRNCSECCEDANGVDGLSPLLNGRPKQVENGGPNGHVMMKTPVEVLLADPNSSCCSSINTEQEQIIQALGTLHRLGIKGARTFRSPSLKSFTPSTLVAARIDCRRLARSLSSSPCCYCNSNNNTLTAIREKADEKPAVQKLERIFML